MSPLFTHYNSMLNSRDKFDRQEVGCFHDECACQVKRLLEFPQHTPVLCEHRQTFS